MLPESLPMPIDAKPFAHQRAAFDFVCRLYGLIDGKCRSTGAALLMDMGTGKTLTSIAVAGALFLEGKIHRVLVIAPLSLLDVWREEIGKFAGYETLVTVLKGSTDQKRKQLKAIDSKVCRFVIINYESTFRLEKELLEYEADLIVCDEGHKIKTPNTAQSKAIHRLGDKANYRLLLTGTLITNKELDVWSQYRFVNKSIFGASFYGFRNMYFDMTGYGNYTPIFREKYKEEFLRRLHSIAFRITKEECLDLPEVTEEIRGVDLEPTAMKIYRQLEQESYAELVGAEVSAVNVLTKLLRLSQLTGGHLTDDTGNLRSVSTAKLEALSEVIDSTLAGGGKLVIMARFVAEMDDIQRLLKRKGIGFAAVRGGVKDRAEEVRRFQEDSGCSVFLGQLVAAGLGLTLTAASTMVFYSMDYSMSSFEQAKARINRVSQQNRCLYIYLIAKDTVDLKVLKALRGKTDLAKSLVDDWRHGRNPFHAS